MEEQPHNGVKPITENIYELLKDINANQINGHGWLIRSFVRSFVRSIVGLFVRSFVGSLVRSLVCPSFVRLFVGLFVGSLVRSFVCLLKLIPSLAHIRITSIPIKATISIT